MSLLENVVAVIFAVILALAITIVSLRLLGIRRGWPMAFASAVAGWGIGAALAGALSGWDWGADGFFLQMAAIGIPATMGFAVALDLLAIPGSLAGAGQAGLLVTPRPFGDIRRRVDVARRYRELLGLIRRHGFGPLLGAGGKAQKESEPVETRLRRLLEEAGGVYVKVGQIAATRADLLPPEMCAELASLQNRVPAEPRHRIEPVLEAELGRPVAEVFAEFEWEPLAAASIGQTHRATLHSGEKVVVKVQRPDIERSMERDLAALAQVAGVAERRTPLGRNIRSGEILAQFAENLLQELDFVGEAKSMTEMAVVLDAASGVRVPRAHMELCTRRILVQERFEGVTVADIDDHGGSEPARRALADTLLRSALDQILRVGFFHADPHPGNVFILEDGALGLIDFGAVGRLDPIQREAVVDLMAGLVRGDIGLIRDAIERVADMDEDVPPELLERAIARVLAETLRPGGQTDPKALQQLVLMLAQFGIRLPGDLVLLSRALVTLDGTLGAMSPGLTIASAVAEVSASTDGRPVLDQKAMVRDALLTTLPRLRRLPDRIDRIVTMAARGDLRVRTFSTRTASGFCVPWSIGPSSPGSAQPSSSSAPCSSGRPTPVRCCQVGPASSTSSGTGGCSPAPCSCCAWWRRWRATVRPDGAQEDEGRHSPYLHSARDSGRRVGYGRTIPRSGAPHQVRGRSPTIPAHRDRRAMAGRQAVPQRLPR